MGEKWFDDVPEDTFRTDIDRLYEQAFARIRAGLAQGLGFDAACGGIDVPDAELRRAIIDDMLKVLIAEVHFAKQASLEDLGQTLKIPVDRLEKAKKEMFEDVENRSIEAYHQNGNGGTA